MQSRDRQDHSERGESLIELLVAMTILGTGVVALVGGIGASIVMSDVHRKETTAATVISNYAEAIEGQLASGYQACADVAAYRSLGAFEAPDGYRATLSQVQYWQGTSFSAACEPDSGVQELTLRVTSTDSRASETLAVIIRDPCESASPC